MLPTPTQIIHHLNQYVHGQQRAKQDLAVAVYNHYLSQAWLEQEGTDLGKHHILLIGPDGVGENPGRLPVDAGWYYLRPRSGRKCYKGDSVASDGALQWWQEFETDNQQRPSLIVRLLEELVQREATLNEFYLACLYSNTDNLQANLHYLDYVRLKKRDES